MRSSIRLSGNWQVYPTMPESTRACYSRPPGEYRTVPECAHLQPTFYPHNPYWGDHIRQINNWDWTYRRAFTVPDEPYSRARLCFEGVDYFASVWVNGHFAGEHEGHFAPFDFDVTHLLRPDAQNTLTVRVRSPWDDPIPGKHSPTDRVKRNLVKGLYEHGEGLIPPDVNPIGIWRPTWLVLDDGISLDHIRIQTDLDGTIKLRLRITNATGQPVQRLLKLSVAEIPAGAKRSFPIQTDDDSLLVDLPCGEHAVEHTLHVPNPKWWWPSEHGSPDLYQLTASLHDESGHITDQRCESFGFRSVELERSPERFAYIINGREIAIRGISYLPDIYLSRCTQEQIEHDMALVSHAHLNLVRLHVHVSPPQVYDWCDRAGMLVWQDFELNWIHQNTVDFETRARRMQANMIDMLTNHPSIITWACHNEPTMIYINRQNLERHPDPILYADAIAQDSTRPVFICSGQMESDWQRSGDSHPYLGAIWSKHYTDVYPRRYKLVSEFGIEMPAAADTLQSYPEVWSRLGHLEHQIPDLWRYQAELIRFHVEHFRRLRAEGNAGYIHFWLADLVPQVGCGVLDSSRCPKAGYDALRDASAPLHVAMQHDGRRAAALWVFNDTMEFYEGALVRWMVCRRGDGSKTVNDKGSYPLTIQPNAAQRIMPVRWSGDCAQIDLSLHAADGTLLASNSYEQPFKPLTRPAGYPWKFDDFLGCKVFDRPGALSLIKVDGWIPVAVLEKLAEWGLRRQFPHWLVSMIARVVDQ